MASPDVWRKWQLASKGGPEGLALVSAPIPSAGRSEVVVKILATTATYTDLLVCQGNYRPMPPYPLTPGYDAVGDVVDVGSDVLGVAVGDRVAVMPQNSCMATHVVVSVAPSRSLPPEGLGTAGGEVVKIRRDVAPLDAISSVLTGVTAYQMLHRASGGRLTPDARILVHGCTGGTGGMIVALAKIAGVTQIYGTCSGRNVAAARANGVVAFDYSAGDWAAEIRAHLTSTAGAAAGFNLIFDAVVTGGYFQKDTTLLQRGGKVILYGFTSSTAPGSVAIPSVLYNFISIWTQQSVYSWFSGREAEFYNVSRRRAKSPLEFMEDLRAVLDLIASGRLSQVEGTRVWPFTQAKDALLAIASNTHRGKQLIDVTRDV